MPFGVKPAPEIYQKRQVEVVQGVPGVKVLADDIILVGKGKTLAEATRHHDVKLRNLLQIIKNSGI